MTARIDIALAAARLSEALAASGQPAPVFEAFDRLVAEAIGHRLFTILAWRPADGDVERVYSSRPGDYPLLGRKRMGPTPWGSRVLGEGQSWFGEGAEAIRWAFPDHELILSLGCESCLNAPVRHDGAVLGVVSALDGPGRYGTNDLEALVALSGFLVPALTAR